MPVDQSILRRQRALNEETAGHGSFYESHRERVTDLLAGSSQSGSLCILGAGNCNDVDLARLGRSFERIHLIDIDQRALVTAVENERSELRAKVSLRAPFDIAGFSKVLP